MPSAVDTPRHPSQDEVRGRRIGQEGSAHKLGVRWSDPTLEAGNTLKGSRPGGYSAASDFGPRRYGLCGRINALESTSLFLA
jgi:hypothetical protein